jgi:3-oxoacyl-[acyl-carrier-protein] synthase-3
MIYAKLSSISSYIPKDILTNQDLEKMVDTNDEWITKRTGIKTRHIAKDESTLDLAYNASLIALKRAKIDIKDIDTIICSTLTPDNFCMPSTACVLADKLGANNITAFDISSACSGFIYLLDIAKSMIESGNKKNILIVGAEKMSSIMDYTDRGTCILFGDGAGASVISATQNKNESIIDVQTSSDGSYGDILYTPNKGEKAHCLQMNGNEVFKFAVKTLCSDAVSILEKNNINSEQIDYFIPHQANLRIIRAVQDRLGLDSNKIATIIEKYGNTSSASIPMAMNDVYESKKLKNGDLMLLNAIGGGFAWGSALVYFNGE